MQIHELTQRPKKINEDLASFFGLNNPVVKQAWDQIGGELIQDLSARFTKDPRYANMPLEQRKKAIAQDQAVQQTAQQKNDEWQKYIASLEQKNRGTPFTDQQYQAAFINWANQSLFNGKFNSMDSAVKAKAQEYFNQFIAHRGDPDAKRRNMFQTSILSNLIADETARIVQVATDLKKAQAGQMTPPTAAKQVPGYKATTTNAPTAGVPQVGSNLPQATTAGVAPTATPPSGPVRGAQPGAPTPAELQKFDQLIAKAAKAQT